MVRKSHNIHVSNTATPIMKSAAQFRVFLIANNQHYNNTIRTVNRMFSECPTLTALIATQQLVQTFIDVEFSTLPEFAQPFCINEAVYTQGVEHFMRKCAQAHVTAQKLSERHYSVLSKYE